MSNAHKVVDAYLRQLDQNGWYRLLLESSKNNKWHQEIWSQNKTYCKDIQNDGRKPQKPTRENTPKEIPYERKIFWPSPNGRFSLGTKKAVAYLSDNAVTSEYETNPTLRKNDNAGLDQFQAEREKSDSDSHGYLLHFHLTEDVRILDLSYQSTPFFDSFTDIHAKEEIWDIIISRDDEVKQSTQLISHAAETAGFDGIVYKSVRSVSNVVMPDNNLVMFNESKVIEGAPQ